MIGFARKAVRTLTSKKDTMTLFDRITDIVFPSTYREILKLVGDYQRICADYHANSEKTLTRCQRLNAICAKMGMLILIYKHILPPTFLESALDIMSDVDGVLKKIEEDSKKDEEK